MTGERGKVTAKRGYINRHVRHGLGHIHEQEGPVVVADLRNLPDGRDHTEHVRGMGDRNKPGLVGNRRFQRCKIERIIVTDPHNIHFNTKFPEMIPWQEVGVVLKNGGDDPVARL